MKQTFKLTMMALAVFGLASCSSDDFFGNGEKAQLDKKNALTVEVENMLDPTTMRSAYVPDAGNARTATLAWQNEDQIQIFGENFAKYDVYTYTPEQDAFIYLPLWNASRQEHAVTEPIYALFASQGGTLGWKQETDEVYATYKIDSQWTWAEDDETSAGEGVLAYQSNLPLWGTAEKDDEYNVKAKMYYLTSILRVDLKNVPGNAKSITVEGWLSGDANDGSDKAPMTGTFEVVLSKQGAEPDTETYLKPITDYDGSLQGTYDNKLTVDIEEAKKNSTVVLIPLIVQKYSKIEVKVWDTNNGTGNVVKENSFALNAKRGAFNRWAVDAFEIGGATVSALNSALEAYSEEDEVLIETTNETEVATDDYILTIPEMKTKSITLDLKGLDTSDNADLHIISPEAEYDGELIIKVNEGSYDKHIFVNLPKATVKFMGEGLENVKLGSDVPGENLIAKSLIIAPVDDETATKVNAVYVNSEAGGSEEFDVLVAEGAEVGALELKKGKKVNLKTVAIDGKLTDALDATSFGEDHVVDVTIGDNATLEGGLKTYQTNLTIGMQAVIGKNDDANKNVIELLKGGNVVGKPSGEDKGATIYGYIEITGEGTFHIKGETTVSRLVGEDVTDVKVDNRSKVIGAIKTPSANVTLLRQAYVNQIQNAKLVTLENQSSANNVTADGLIVNTKGSVTTATIKGDVTIARTEEGEAVKTKLTMTGAAFEEEEEYATLTLTGGYIAELVTGEPIIIVNNETNNIPTALIAKEANSVKLAKDYTSVWAGKKITTTNEDFAKYASVTRVYTASQLASQDGTASWLGLKANLNLGGNPWTPQELKAKSFDGEKHTISGLTVSTDKENAGLFSKASADAVEIRNLTVTGASITSTKAAATGAKTNTCNVGILLGFTNADVTVKNVKVSNSSVQATKDYASNIGGLVGFVGSSFIAESDTVSVSLVKGQYNLGGLVGLANDANISKSDVTAVTKFEVLNAVTERTLGDNKRDEGAGFVGMYAGLVNTLKVDKVNKAANNVIKDNRVALGFKANSVSESSKDYYYYGSASGDVGKANTSYTVGTTAQTVPSTKADKVASVKANEYNVYVDASATDYK